MWPRRLVHIDIDPPLMTISGVAVFVVVAGLAKSDAYGDTN
jgi:hypothetical protein